MHTLRGWVGHQQGCPDSVSTNYKSHDPAPQQKWQKKKNVFLTGEESNPTTIRYHQVGQICSIKKSSFTHDVLREESRKCNTFKWVSLMQQNWENQQKSMKNSSNLFYFYSHHGIRLNRNYQEEYCYNKPDLPFLLGNASKLLLEKIECLCWFCFCWGTAAAVAAVWHFIPISVFMVIFIFKI